jgi:hypothetical protein
MKNCVFWDVTLMMEKLSSSETSVLTRAAQRNIPEDGILLTISSSIEVTQSEQLIVSLNKL